MYVEYSQTDMVIVGSWAAPPPVVLVPALSVIITVSGGQILKVFGVIIGSVLHVTPGQGDVCATATILKIIKVKTHKNKKV